MPPRKDQSKGKRSKADQRSRRQIIEFLKVRGALDARAIADEIGTSAMAVRQHLYQMHDEKLVTFREEARPVGRPAKLWQLTAAADQYLPDAHAALALDLIESLAETIGARGLDKLVAHRAEGQVASYRQRIPKRASLQAKLEQLVELRSEEGYMAEIQTGADGAMLLVENHCPICAAAAACTGLCSAELDVSRQVLGEKVQVERTEHILEGARRCAYRVAKN